MIKKIKRLSQLFFERRVVYEIKIVKVLINPKNAIYAPL